jgi:hypothetical protein
MVIFAREDEPHELLAPVIDIGEPGAPLLAVFARGGSG